VSYHGTTAQHYERDIQYTQTQTNPFFIVNQGFIAKPVCANISSIIHEQLQMRYSYMITEETTATKCIMNNAWCTANYAHELAPTTAHDRIQPMYVLTGISVCMPLQLCCCSSDTPPSCHPQNWMYRIYCNIGRGGLSHSHRQSGEVKTCAGDKLADTPAYNVITNTASPIVSKVKMNPLPLNCS